VFYLVHEVYESQLTFLEVVYSREIERLVKSCWKSDSTLKLPSQLSTPSLGTNYHLMRAVRLTKPQEISVFSLYFASLNVLRLNWFDDVSFLHITISK